MRFFWSVVLTGGLLLIGIDGYESREIDSGTTSAVALAEDGTPFPPPPPPPPQ